MNITQLIRKKQAVRCYTNKKVSKRILNRIVNAGRWTPSIHGFQPWLFKVVVKKRLIKQIAATLVEKKSKVGVGTNIFLRTTADTISDATAIIVVYNTGEFVRFADRLRKSSLNNRRGYKLIAELSESQAVGAAIQNMLLVAEDLGVGSCWTITPLFCQREINHILGERKDMMAIITLGYPASKSRRSRRKPIAEVCSYF